MNKAPQPITGPLAVPHPAPSPGLPQPSFPPVQPTAVLFAPPPPPQMNSTPQPRQFPPGPRAIHQQGGFRSLQPYYANRANMSTSSGPPGVPPSNAPRAVAPTHVYQAGPGSQIMMIPQQQLPFSSSSQGHTYFIPGQYRSTTYVTTPQQYQVTASPPGFYPGTSPAEYAGAYYPAQPQFAQPQAPPVIMNPAPQQQQLPPQPAPHIRSQRERKQIRIRDPNQGGRDITEEIMSGHRIVSTQTSPQRTDGFTQTIFGSEASPVTQANGENVTAADTTETSRPEYRGKPIPPSKTPEHTKSEPTPTEARPHITDTKAPSRTLPLDTHSSGAPGYTTSTPPVADVMDAPPQEHIPSSLSAPEVPAYPAPLPAPRPAPTIQDKTAKEDRSEEEEVQGGELKQEEHKVEPTETLVDTHLIRASSNNDLAESNRPSVILPSNPMEAPLESPIAQPEELRLPNGLPLPAPRDPEAPAVNIMRERDDSPIAEPDVAQPLITTVHAAAAHSAPASIGPVETSTPLTRTTASMAVSSPTTSMPSVIATTPTPIVRATTPTLVVRATTPTAVVSATTSTAVVSATTSTAVVSSTTSMPSVKATTPKPVVRATTPTPVVRETTPMLVVQAPAHTPVVQAPKPTPVIQAPKPTPVAQEPTLTPVAQEPTPTPVAEAPKPTPVDQAMAPTPLVLATMPMPVVEASSTPSKSTAETGLPVSSDTQVETLMTLQPATKVEALEASRTPSPPAAEEREDTPPLATASLAAGETTMQAALSVPKKRRKMKELNKKEAVGDLLDAFKEEQVVVAPTQPEPAPAPEAQAPASTSPPAPDEADLTWEDKEDKLDNKNTQPEDPKSPGSEKKYQYKEEQWEPLNPEEKKKYDREFLLGFQFISASMNKPKDLPLISDVVLDKANKVPLRQLDSSRLPGMTCGPDFTPSFANLGRPGMGGGGMLRGLPPTMGGSGGGLRRSQQGQRKEPRKIITSMSLNDDVQLNKAEKAWTPSVKKAIVRGEESDAEQIKTQELFKRVRSILNKLTPQMFQQLMKQVTELTIDTEQRLKGVIDLIFEKAISEPNFSVAYANMCRCLMGLRVPTTDQPEVTVNFRKLLLNRCQKEFEKDMDDDEFFEKKQKELDAASGDEERQRLKEELEEAKDKARRRSLGNIKFIGELFKLKMLTEIIMHDCIIKLLRNRDEESLECMCRLLSTIGKDLDFKKAKPRVDQYFLQMVKIIKEKKTSSRIRFMLQDVVDLRSNDWVPRRGDQGPKTIDQIHREAELEEHREQIKVQQALISKNESGGGRAPRMANVGGAQGGRGPHMQGRGGLPQDEGWNTVPISTKNRPIDTSRLSKITKTPVLDFNNQLLAPGGKGTWGSWGKGSSGGTAKPAETGLEQAGRAGTSTPNRFSALQQSSGTLLEPDRRTPQRNSSSRERMDRSGDRFEQRNDRDRNHQPVNKRSFSRENEERSQEREHQREPAISDRHASMMDERDRGNRDWGNRDRGNRDPGIKDRGSRDRGSRDRRDRARSKESVKRDVAPTPPPPQTPTKPALTEEELEKKSIAIIEEYLHINDLKEALQCVQEMNCTKLLFVFVRSALESTLERSTLARERMGILLHQLIKTDQLPIQQYYKGLRELLEVAEDMAIDIPHIWLYLAELITPMLHDGGIPMGQLFKEISKPLIPLGLAGTLLVEILTLLCKGMSHKKAGAMWREAGLSWKDFLPEDTDVNLFVTEKNVEFTLGDESEKGGKKKLSGEEMATQLNRLIHDKADNQRIFNWIEANLDEQQTSSNTFIRALMTSICQSAIICDNPYKVDSDMINRRAKLLQKYLKDEQKELQALYALQAVMVEMEQPANLLRMFFDTLYDEDVIKEEAFYKWESSKDPAEIQGKGVALKSVTAFFTWLREAEVESDNN